MQLETKTVKRKSDGHVCTINATDFDPKEHDEVKSAAPTTSAASETPTKDEQIAQPQDSAPAHPRGTRGR